MAHELATRADGRAAMAFTGETPWHGLGQRMPEGATIETWQTAAGLDWDAALTEVRFAPAGHTAPLTYTGQSVIYRNDTNNALGIVSDGYRIVQPREILEFFRDMTEEGGWHIHTAGALRGGRKIWALARNHTEGDVVPGDTVRGNLLLATSMDGSLATHCGMTAIRVVCANTLRVALQTDRKPGERDHGMVKTTHRSVFDAASVKRTLGVARESFEVFMQRARKLAAMPVKQEEARDILRTLFLKPAKLEAAPVVISGGTVDGSEFAQLLARPAAVDIKQARENRNVARCLELFGGAGRGATHDGSDGTRWGLLNAVTEFVDHEQGRTGDTRLDSAWFGDGATLKTKAMDLMTA